MNLRNFIGILRTRLGSGDVMFLFLGFSATAPVLKYSKESWTLNNDWNTQYDQKSMVSSGNKSCDKFREMAEHDETQGF